MCIRDSFPYLYAIGEGNSYDWANYGSSYGFTGLTYTGLASDQVTWEVATKRDLPVDLDLLSTPINYMSYRVCPLDKKEHDVQFYIETTPVFTGKAGDLTTSVIVGVVVTLVGPYIHQ